MAEAVVRACSRSSNFRFLYPLEKSIEEKMEIIAKEIYHADGIEILPEAREKIERYKRQGNHDNTVTIEIVYSTQYSMLYICTL